MKQPLFAEERREKILQLLSDHSKLLVPELCERFAVSPATIRGDLRDLEAEGKLRRTHGGAIPLRKIGFEPDSSYKEIRHIEQKQRIAAQALKLIEDGDTIALDTGTTTLELAKLLPGKHGLTVVSNDVKIISYLEANSDANLILAGGSVRRGFHCTTGPLALSALQGLNVDKAFLATNAYSPEKGFTTPTFGQAEVKRAMLAIAAQTVMLADSSKLGRVTFLQFADTGEIDVMITDIGAAKPLLAEIQALDEGIEIYTV